MTDPRTSADLLSRERYNAQRAMAAAMSDLRLGRRDMVAALDACRRQVETRALMERTIAAAGYRYHGFVWDRALEAYYNIQDERREVAYLAKGWGDPGFRLGQIVDLPAHCLGVFHYKAAELRRHCAVNGIVMSERSNRTGRIEVMLEYAIYSAGFNADALAAALETIIECSMAVVDLETA